MLVGRSRGTAWRGGCGGGAAAARSGSRPSGCSGSGRGAEAIPAPGIGVIGRRLGGRVLLVAVVALGLTVEGCFDRGALRDASPGRRATAVASWYGEPFHGRLTAPRPAPRHHR